MRPRICMAIVSSKCDGTTFFNCNREEIERNKRRAQFEKSRKVTVAIIGKSTPELNSYSMGVLNVIAEFRKRKANERLNTNLRTY